MKKADETPTRAISIRQPYAELILRGKKKTEYRSVRTNIRETVYVYASRTPADDEESWNDVGAEAGSLPTGVIVGTVDIVDCEGEDGDFAYVLARPKRLAKPLPAVNQAQPIFWRPRFE